MCLKHMASPLQVKHNFFGGGLRLLQCDISVFPLGVLYLEHSELAFLDCVIIACRLESSRPDPVQGCKDSNGVGKASLITSLESGLPHRTKSVALGQLPLGLKLLTASLALVELHCYYY